MIKEAQANILLLTKDETTVSTLNSVLREGKDMVLSGLCQDFSELASHLKNTIFQAVIIDIDPDPIRILPKVGTITTMYPEMRVIVISNSFSNDLILHAMQAGARHYLRKSSITAELETVLEQIVSDGLKSEVESGSIITVLPVRGGCGATTVAINLSNEIRIASSEEILMIDLDNYYASLALYLGISTEYGLSDILSRKDIIDEYLLRSSSYNYMRDFHVLTNRSAIDSADLSLPEYDNLISIFEVCKNAYKYTIVDAPSRLDMRIIEKLVEVSEVVLIVFQLTVKDLKLARPLLSLIQSLTSSNKIVLLANQFDKRKSMIGLKDCKQALGLDCLCSVRNDYQKVLDSFNLSQPIAQFAPKSKMRHDFQLLTSNVINVMKKDGILEPDND